QQLFLARDRFGIKPLYYAQHQGRLIFGSEIKTILAQPNFPRRVNLAALEAMLTLGFVPGPATMFEGVYKLPAAHFLLARAGNIEITRYWQLDYRPAAPPLDEREAVAHFLTLLEEAISLRLMSEVPLGALLSGGLDSGTLVALVQAGLHKQSYDHNVAALIGGERNQLRTISIGFEQPGYDEAPLASELAHFIGTDHHPITLTATDFAEYPTVLHHLEEPQCSATALPIYKLYQACRRAGLTVVLTGEGADELLGGYHWHRGDALVRPLLPLPSGVRHLLAGSPLPMSTAARRVLRRGSTDVCRRYREWLMIGGEHYRQDLLAPIRQAENPLLHHWAESLTCLPDGAAPLHRMLWLESQTRMIDFINFEVDKMSMAHSIEARVPFLDHKLWEFCAGLSPRLKLKGRTEKYLLRQATRTILPQSTRTRPKKGLAAPYAVWLRADRLSDWAEAALSPGGLRRTGLFQPETVAALRRAHQARQPHLAPLLMGVLSSQLWYECFIDERELT
ncbi:MAG: asparagine synthase (glutamine-hydrolyzing), partial [Anaerolineae bacterium]|nr:asparagine synthase (glutamine-hydrolyzing) [Anaerolineae bacterium]